MTSQTVHEPQPKSVNWSLFIVRMIIFTGIVPLALFLAAGRLDWWMGWVYVVIATVITIMSRYLMVRRNPDLLEERVKALGREDTKSWDKLIVLIVAILGPLAQIIIAGLDMRYDWSPSFLPTVELVGVAVMLAGYLFASWAMLVNAFYSSVVRIQSDRDQVVITAGPYRFMRHPSYIGMVIGIIGASLVLSSLWSLIPVAVVTIALVIRTVLEDATLHAELAGYQEYAQQTRYRWIPGVW